MSVNRLLASKGLILLCTYLELRRTIELCIYIVSSIIILPVCVVYCPCIGSLLIYMDCLLDFVSVSKYGSSSGRAVGLTFRLGQILIYVRLEYFRLSSIHDEMVYIYIV